MKIINITGTDIYPVVYIDEINDVYDLMSENKLHNIGEPTDIIFVYDGVIYHYYDKPIKNNVKPGIYVDGFIPYTDDAEYKIEKYNVVDLSDPKIITDTIKHNMTTFEQNITPTENTNWFKPPYNPEDDFLKQSIKAIFAINDIDLKTKIAMFSEPHYLSNTKSSLLKDSRMSPHTFNVWCEVLDISWKMELTDASGNIIIISNTSPLSPHIKNEDGSLTSIF